MERSTIPLIRILAVIALALGLTGLAAACTAGSSDTPGRTSTSATAPAGGNTDAHVKQTLEDQGFHRVIKARDLDGVGGVQTLASLQFPGCHQPVELAAWPLKSGRGYGLEVASNKVHPAPNLVIGERDRPLLTAQPSADQVKQFHLCG